MSDDDLQLLREFRAEIPGPSNETRRRIYDHAMGQAKARPRRRRWKIPSVAAAAATAAAAVAVLLVSPWSGSGDGFVQRALAAVGSGPVMHIVMEDSTHTNFFNLKTGRERGGNLREEMWIDRRNDRFQFIHTQGGRFLVDLHGTFRSAPGSTSPFRPAFSAAALVRFYVALATGAHTAVVGRGTLNGHPIVWLRSPTLDAPGEIGVDARTYKPVLLRTAGVSFPSRKRTYVYERILLAKAIPYVAEDFRPRGPVHNREPQPVAIDLPGFTRAHVSPAIAGSTIVRAPWLTAGPTLGGLKLRAVRPFTFRKENRGAPKPTVHGLELVYGPPRCGQTTNLPTRIDVFGPHSTPRARMRCTTIYEFHGVSFGPSTSWSNFPTNSIQVQTGYTTVGRHIVPTPWIGYMRRQGLYLTISTPQGEHTPLKIGRSLHSGLR